MRYALVLVAVLALGTTASAAERDPVKRILQDLETVPRPGVPGVLSVFGTDAEAVLTANDRAEPVIAVAEHEKGRVVAFAHSGYFGVKPGAAKDDPWRVLLDNALHWAAGREKRLRVALDGAPDRLAKSLVTMGHDVVPPDLLIGPKRPHVVIWHSARGTTPKDEARISAYVAAGGGLITAQCPWGWEQIRGRDGKTLVDDLPENHVLRPMGLVFALGTADANQNGRFAIAKSRPQDAHAGRALASVVSGGKGASASVHLIEKAIRSLPADDDVFRPAVEKAVRRVKNNAFPRPSKPLSRKRPLARLAVAHRLDVWSRAHAADIPAAPGAEEFPGAVARKAERVTVEITLDPAVKGRIVTGLYAAPGEMLTIRRTSTNTRRIAARDWRVRIGAHSDRLWNKDVWKRWPEVSRTTDLAGTTTVASPFGGAVYFEAVGGEAGPVTVSVAGAVRAPRFVLGQDDVKSWKVARKAPAPWAELEGRHMVLTVPSGVARRLDDPAPLLAWWDSVLVSHCELGMTPVPVRRERFCPDVQISAGYMHSGYPIMTHLDVVEAKGERLPHMIDVERLQKEGGWGFFHELGHNRQRKAWTFGGTGEVTCNLFSLYSHEKVVGIPSWDHSWLGNQKAKAAKHVEAGAPFRKWKSSPGIALVTYAQFVKTFGWEQIRKVFADYEALGEAKWPKTDAERIDQFALRLSAAVKHDLRPYFRKWGWPLGDALMKDETIGNLPVWMPDFTEITAE